MSLSHHLNVILLAAVVLMAGSTFGLGQSVRNLSDYSSGPEVDIYPYSGPGNDAEDGLRNFLYDSWTNRRRAFVMINYYSVEGRKTPCTYFVEPKNDGGWVVVSECCIWLPGKPCDARNPMIDEFDSIEKKISERKAAAGFRLLLTNSSTGQKEEI